MGQFTFIETKLAGVYEIILPSYEDNRGTFTKLFHHDEMSYVGIDFSTQESYFSYSNKGVIRGMHFQLPPYHHAKVVLCPYGAIDDTVVDLRTSSSTYGQYHDVTLSRDNHKALYIPEGFAHGFQALQDDSMTLYLVSSMYHPQSDTGIRYDSIGKEWASYSVADISPRDLSFPTLDAFISPF